MRHIWLAWLGSSGPWTTGCGGSWRHRLALVEATDLNWCVGDLSEAAVTPGRIAAEDGRGAVFAPLAMGGAGGRPIQSAVRHLDGIKTWEERAEATMAPLSGRPPAALHTVFTEWPE